jgi:23S rRNA (uracil1939-C5)-methyltransferase
MQIQAIGADGDGIARRPDGTTVFIPYTLPGEDADDGVIAHPSPDRVTPPCPHFGTCGGCALQHWATAPYQDWKRDLLVSALTRAGYENPEVAPLIPSPPNSRRRMDLAAERRGPALVLGFHQRRGGIIDIDACPVLAPALEALIAPMRQMLRRLTALKREASVIVNLLDSGPDILLKLDVTPDAADRRLIAEFAAAQNAPRISFARGAQTPEIAIQHRRPTALLSGIEVLPPPGAFLQATLQGEAAIISAVLAGLPKKKTLKDRVADLYAGSGTLTFALVPHFRVAAYEGDPAATSALRAAANAAVLTGRIETAHRDLVRQPLMAKELATFAGVVLDPPFDGAALQIAQIATAKPPRVIYVSCNPAALSRDAKTLHSAGYRLVSATPIDQFLWSARLESVVVFAIGK